MASQVVLVVENPPANAGDARGSGWIPGLEKSSGVGNCNPYQYSFYLFSKHTCQAYLIEEALVKTLYKGPDTKYYRLFSLVSVHRNDSISAIIA